MDDRLAKLEKLLAADPRDAELCYMIALEHSKAGRFADAVDWLDRTLELDPRQHYAYFQKGKSLAAMGRPGDARRTIETGLNRAHEDGNPKAAGELAELLDSISA
jgi:tetratricopeptide (TPR) repeat protein